MRLLVLLVPLLIAVGFAVGFYVGGAGKRKAIAHAVRPVQGVVSAARQLAAVDPLDDPQSWAVQRMTARQSLDLYDNHQHNALL